MAGDGATAAGGAAAASAANAARDYGGMNEATSDCLNSACLDVQPQAHIVLQQN